MTIYRKRRQISIAVLASIILILLLSLNFHIWSGSYTEGDLEAIVIQQMDCLAGGDTDEGISRESVEQCLHLFDYACLGGIEINVCLPCAILSGIWLGYFFLRPSITLCSLSVRIND